MTTEKKGDQVLFFQKGKNHSSGFGVALGSGAPTEDYKFANRFTGGCGDMTAADAIGMKNLQDAYCGFTNRRGPRRRFRGTLLFGGTRMLSVHDPKQIVPGITELPPEIIRQCPGSKLVAIIAGFDGVIFDRDNPELADKTILQRGKNIITIIHPEPSAVLMVEPNENREVVYDDEYFETHRQFQDLHTHGWKTLNTVYNGGGTTEREILLWAQWGRRQPGFWNMLLIKNSGRKADEYANNQEFLDAHPNMHVAENDVDAINDKLFELGAVAEVADENVFQFRKPA